MHLFSPETIETFLHHYGYGAVFVIIALESSGLPLPGEATLVSAAIYAAATHALSLPLIVFWASAGAVVGDNIGFWIGRTFGLALLLRYGAHVGLDEPRLKLGQYLFAQHGGKIVFFGRFIAVLRALAAILAGANRYPWSRFLIFNAAGGITWAALYASAAYLLGHSIHRLIGPVGLTLLAVALVVGFAGWRFLKRHEAKLQAEANAAIPGPLRPALTQP
jgi:membrane protein DedA with SNARE-associated domain